MVAGSNDGTELWSTTTISSGLRVRTIRPSSVRRKSSARFLVGIMTEIFGMLFCSRRCASDAGLPILCIFHPHTSVVSRRLLRGTRLSCTLGEQLIFFKVDRLPSAED